MKPMPSDSLPYSSGRRKKLRRACIELNLPAVRKDPKACALYLKYEKKWFAESISDDQAEDHVKDVIADIDRNGYKYGENPRHLDRLLKAPDFKKAMKPRKPDVGTTLMPEKEFKPREADKPWSDKLRDQIFDRLFSGQETFESVAHHLKRTPVGIERQFELLLYDEQGRKAKEYKPFRRVWRGGMRFTPLEKEVIARHKKDGVSIDVTARVLQRSSKELGQGQDARTLLIKSEMKRVASGVDLALAHRYLYWCAKQPVISDQEYDDLKQEEMEYGPGSQVLAEPASDKPIDYPDRIRSLGHYLLCIYKGW